MLRLKVSFVVVLVFILAVAGIGYAADNNGIDFGGKTITFLYFDPSEPFDAELMAEAEDVYNFKHEYKVAGWDEYVATAMARLIAGDSNYDVWLMGQSHFIPLVGNNAVLAMDGILPEGYKDDMESTLQARIEAFKVKGKTYAFNSWTNVMNDMIFWVYNRDIFEQEGLDDPQDLFEAGEWTWDKAEEIGLQATKDTNGDGEVDRYGIGDMSELYTLVPNGAKTIILKDDKFVFGYNEPEALQALNLVYRWETLLKIAQGTWDIREFQAGTRAMTPIIGWQFWSLMNSDINYGVVPLPKGPNMDHNVFPVDKVGMIYLPANSAMPQEMAEVVKFLSPDEYSISDTMDSWISMWAKDERSAMVMAQGIEDWNGEFDIVGGVDLGIDLGPIYSGEKSAAAQINEIYPAVQAQIDEIFNQ